MAASTTRKAFWKASGLLERVGTPNYAINATVWCVRPISATTLRVESSVREAVNVYSGNVPPGAPEGLNASRETLVVKTKPRAASQKPVVAFEFIKSNYFRTTHANGVWGGINNQLEILMAFYSERHPIPQRVIHEISNSTLGSEILEQRQARKGVVREVEIQVSMNIETAKAFREWLDQKIVEAETFRAQRSSRV